VNRPIILRHPDREVVRVVQDATDQLALLNPAPLPAPLDPPVGLVPGPDDAVQLQIAPDQSADSFHTATLGGVAYRGPRRIWSVSGLSNRPAKRRRMVRYRIPLREVDFGLFTCRFLEPFSNASLQSVTSQTGSPWELSYGIIIRGIPWFGTEKPEAFMGARILGDTPSSLVGLKGVGVAGSPAYLAANQRYGEAKTEEDFEANPAILFESFKNTALAETVSGDSHNWPAPDDQGDDYAGRIQGLTVMLVSGETTLEVYGQVNSLESQNLSRIRGSAVGPSIGVPERLVADSPTVAGLATVNAAGTQLTPTTTAAITGAISQHVVEGCPVEYRDCATLVRTMNTFSLVLEVARTRILPAADTRGMLLNPSNDQFPAAWHTVGVHLVRGDRRRTDIDLVMV